MGVPVVGAIWLYEPVGELDVRPGGAILIHLRAPMASSTAAPASFLAAERSLRSDPIHFHNRDCDIEEHAGSRANCENQDL